MRKMPFSCSRRNLLSGLQAKVVTAGRLLTVTGDPAPLLASQDAVCSAVAACDCTVAIFSVSGKTQRRVIVGVIGNGVVDALRIGNHTDLIAIKIRRWSAG